MSEPKTCADCGAKAIWTYNDKPYCRSHFDERDPPVMHIKSAQGDVPVYLNQHPTHAHSADGKTWKRCGSKPDIEFVVKPVTTEQRDRLLAAGGQEQPRHEGTIKGADYLKPRTGVRQMAVIDCAKCTMPMPATWSTCERCRWFELASKIVSNAPDTVPLIAAVHQSALAEIERLKANQVSGPYGGSGQFSCPECGGHHWGTKDCTAPDEQWVGRCNGCGFEWLRIFDGRHFGKDCGGSTRGGVSQDGVDPRHHVELPSGIQSTPQPLSPFNQKRTVTFEPSYEVIGIDYVSRADLAKQYPDKIRGTKATLVAIDEATEWMDHAMAGPQAISMRPGESRTVNGITISVKEVDAPATGLREMVREIMHSWSPYAPVNIIDRLATSLERFIRSAADEAGSRRDAVLARAGLKPEPSCEDTPYPDSIDDGY